MLKEHEAAKWLGMRKIDAVDWLPADRIVVENSRKRVNKRALWEMTQIPALINSIYHDRKL